MELINKMEKVKESLVLELKEVTNLTEFNKLKLRYLGKKGLIANLTKQMKELTKEEKKEIGRYLNQLKEVTTVKINDLYTKLSLIKLADEKLEEIDVTLPGTKFSSGLMHPVARLIEEIEDIFRAMGYDVVAGPEIESDLYNFELLNLPKGHPARDMQDSFYINEDMLLRTHTSPVQIRTMLANKNKLPLRIICPGKVYRRDEDATHTHQFTQIEGLFIDKKVSMADLKGTLTILVKEIFGSDRIIRFRPNYFPFTEPSIEVDVSCASCQGKGCLLCKQSGWLEILGAGMVHPNVLTACGYDPKVYKGFAFGMGIERILMLKYGLHDIRELYVNDIRFLNNFNRIDGGDINEG